jgi:predicted transcriptional regulator
MPKTRTTTPAESTAASAAAMTPSMKALLDLLSADHGATAAELAGRAGIGRSTAAKTLAALESAGSARREPGARTGQRPEPDLWFAITLPTTPAHDPAPDEVPDVETATAQHGEPRDQETGEAEGVDDAPQPETASDDEVEPDTADTAACAEMADSPQPAVLGADCADGATATGAAAPAGGDAPAVTAPHAAQSEGATPPRLAKGGLRAMVVDYLTAHRDEEMTASTIGKSLKRSSGAVANALDTLVKSGQAELTCEKPRRFRHRAPQTGN